LRKAYKASLHFVALKALTPQDFGGKKIFKKTSKKLEKSVDKPQIKCYINQALRCCGCFKVSPATKIQMKKFEKSC